MDAQQTDGVGLDLLRQAMESSLWRMPKSVGIRYCMIQAISMVCVTLLHNSLRNTKSSELPYLKPSGLLRNTLWPTFLNHRPPR